MEAEVDKYLDRVLLEVTVARRILAEDLGPRTVLREESIQGFILVLARDSFTHQMMVNGLPCGKVDLLRNNTVVHLVEGLAVPLELEQNIAFADPDDLDPDLRFAASEGGSTGHNSKASKGGGAEDGSYEDDEDEDGAQEDKSDDDGEVAGKSSTKDSLNSLSNRIQKAESEGVTSPEEDSDARNRDVFVKEGEGESFLEKPEPKKSHGKKSKKNRKKGGDLSSSLKEAGVAASTAGKGVAAVAKKFAKRAAAAIGRDTSASNGKRDGAPGTGVAVGERQVAEGSGQEGASVGGERQVADVDGSSSDSASGVAGSGSTENGSADVGLTGVGLSDPAAAGSTDLGASEKAVNDQGASDPGTSGARSAPANTLTLLENGGSEEAKLTSGSAPVTSNVTLVTGSGGGEGTTQQTGVGEGQGGDGNDNQKSNDDKDEDDEDEDEDDEDEDEEEDEEASVEQALTSDRAETSAKDQMGSMRQSTSQTATGGTASRGAQVSNAGTEVAVSGGGGTGTGGSANGGTGGGGGTFKWFSGLGFGRGNGSAAGSSGGAKASVDSRGTANGKEEAEEGREKAAPLELRGAPVKKRKQKPRPPPLVREEVYCSGRGVLTNGVCECAMLFRGFNCEFLRDIRELGIEGYPGELVMSVELLYDELYAVDPANQNSTGGGVNTPGLGVLARLIADMAPAQRLELRRALPPWDPLEAAAWDTCAVVGSSGSLLMQELGEEIDAHEMVIRFNAAPTYGYETQVGRKTTIRISHPEFAGFKEGSEMVLFHVWLRDTKAEMLRLLKFKRMFSRDPLLILELGFLTAVYNALGFIPSIGYYGWAFALQKCKRVDLYGFFMDERHGVKHHYYNRNSTSKGTEDMDKEFVAALDIADAELMWMAESCLYDCRRSTQRCSNCLRMPLPMLAQKSEWNSTQLLLNAARERKWREFLNWEDAEKKKGAEARARKQSKRARRRPRQKRLNGGKQRPMLLEEWGDEREVPWDSIVTEGRLGQLSLRELLLYFRQFHVTVPPTRLQMMQSIRSHFYFMHRELERQHARLYKPAD
eukprot:TRINITY_DN211_c1_g1_i1.p1 TRINITY_DN211_c1_g1~~TRINITY_DN211_c1_g1_i1.p1  ORF type:complete len:1174 (-),score=270.23 TRINITY_DN211_c1_g1_i1:934-4071(-)